MSVSRFTAYIGQQIELGIKFKYDQTGEDFDPASVNRVEVIDEISGEILEVIQASSITRIALGHYTVTTNASWNTRSRKIIDRWYHSLDPGPAEVYMDSACVIYAPPATNAASVTRFTAYINQKIELGIKFRWDRSGELFDPLSVDKVEVIDALSGGLLETIQSYDISHKSLGYFTITTSSAWNTRARSVIDRWYYTRLAGDAISVSEESCNIFAAAPAATNMITVSDVKNIFLKGINLEDENGEALDDTSIQKLIDAAVTTVERELRIDIKPRVVISNPDPDEVYDVAESPYDYIQGDFINWGSLQLYRQPTRRINKIELRWPATNALVWQIPESWVRLKARHSQVNIIPVAGALSQIMLGAGGIYLPMLSAGYLGYTPSMIHVDYETGFDVIPNDIWSAIGKVTAIEVLTIMSDAITQGVSNSSISADGLNLSYSRTNSPTALLFQGRIESYSKWLENFYLDGYRFYSGINMLIV